MFVKHVVMLCPEINYSGCSTSKSKHRFECREKSHYFKQQCCKQSEGVSLCFEPGTLAKNFDITQITDHMFAK